MKAEGKTWREIATAMNRSQGSLKKRFKEIGSGGATGGEGGPADAGNGQAKAKDGNTNANAGKSQKQGKHNKGGKDKKSHKNDPGKNAPAPSAPKSPSKPDPKPTANPSPPPPRSKPLKSPTSICPTITTSSSGVKFTLREWQTLYEDDLFSLDELCCLAGIMRRERDWTWRRVASAFADRTGRYVHPEDVREKFERLWEMGERKGQEWMGLKEW